MLTKIGTSLTRNQQMMIVGGATATALCNKGTSKEYQIVCSGTSCNATDNQDCSCDGTDYKKCSSANSIGISDDLAFATIES